MKKLFLSLSLAALCGCASIVSDSSYRVAVTSQPQGANFVITSKEGITVHAGKTPATVTLDAGSGYFNPAGYRVDFRKAGFDRQVAFLDSGIDGWYFGNFLFGGLMGFLLIDPATGAMWRLPANVSAYFGEQAVD
jgi:hypothetical protein